MDTTNQPESVNPNDPLPKGQNPMVDPESESWGQYLKANAGSLIFSVVVSVLVLVYLNVVDVIKVAIGLGLVIFIHELGHFLAAKWCDVHVETFSIGFGKPLPGCKFKYGETTYKIGWIPLGGYVKMIGEGENADTEEAEEDPRSFKNKPVGQRMIIISAGVIMNIILACICFIIVYSHGVDEKPPILGWVEAGSPAWQEGLHSEAVLTELNGNKSPVYDDIRPDVMGSSKGEKIRFVYRDSPKSEPIIADVEPGKDSEALFPVVGVGPAAQLTLAKSRRGDLKPYRAGSPASKATPPFQGGDRIIACSDDPNDWKKVTPLPPDQRNAAAGRLDFFEFQRRENLMRGQKMIIRVQRGDQSEDITVDPAYHAVFGMRMAMGRVAAVRKNFPAAQAKVVSPAGEGDGLQPRKVDAKENSGDRIIEVEVVDNENKKIRWSAGQPEGAVPEGVIVKPLDPMKLPFELESWAEKKTDNRKVLITVLRPTGRKEEKNETKRVTLELEWNESARYAREYLTTPNSPLSIPCLGLAYFVDAVVEAVDDGSPAAAAKMQKGDLIKEVRWKYKNTKGEFKQSRWQEIKSNQWAYVMNELQTAEIPEIDLKIERGDGVIEVTLKAEEDKTWPISDRGLSFTFDTRQQKATDLADALGLGIHRTIRTVRMIYLNLYAMVFGRVSAWTMSGPLTIADVSYKIAGEDLWQFILFIGMINVNLAIINFLPIPVLDGGHMVFMIYEKIRGKPAPESVLAAAMYTGLFLILALMCFVLFLDVKRLWL
ncbi:MAG: RIP metalloprotease RseP [Planctomycetes bacterium]|nr:RIP metalloprotease RseP [Planctomycetota bacterium]